MGTSDGGSVKHYEAARDVSAHDPGLLFPKTNPGDAHVGEARRTQCTGTADVTSRGGGLPVPPSAWSSRTNRLPPPPTVEVCA